MTTSWVPAQFFGSEYDPDTPLNLVPKRHRRTLVALPTDRWIAHRDGGPRGNTQDALERLGVVEGRWVEKPYGHQECRVTALGRRYIADHISTITGDDGV